MAFRGRGRGRGGGGHAKQEPFILFPDIDLPVVLTVTEEETKLVIESSRLQKFWNSSPYYIKDEGKDKTQKTVKENEPTRKKPKLSDFMMISNEYVPAELVPESKLEKTEKSGKKKVRWKLNPDSDMQKLDLFEKLEKKYQGQDEIGEKEKKEDEEEEDDEKIEEEDEEFSDDGDYNQNIDFDDDEDDFNMDDDNDEGAY